ncbi:MAG: glycosyltransferase family 4 protein [Polaribacter sp.]
MKKRNLIVLSYDFPPSTGGIARLCYEITIGLKPYYKNIKVITVDIVGVTEPYNVSSEIEIIKLPPKRFICELKTYQILRKLKNKDTYDVICGIWHPEGFLAYLAGMKNIFVLGHGAEFLSGSSKFRKLFWLPIYAKWVLSNVKKVITNSHFTKNLVEKISSKANVTALPLGVNHTFFSPSKTIKESSKIIKFCTVARILEFKGHDFILKTFENLPESLRSKIEWHIAGTGPFFNDLKTLIKKSPIKEQIIVHGFINDKKLPNFYRNNDVFILATREQEKSNQVEGFGLVFLEAQSCGTPVIGTKTGGISDAIEHKNGGWLFESDNTESLEQILTSIIKTPKKIEEQAIKARERVLKKSTWNIYCSQLFKSISR